MAKRPSAPSTRSKQHQVLRYIYSTSFKTTAKDYNVSIDKVRKFVKANPKSLKSRVLRDPAYLSLYQKDVRQVAKQHKTKLISRLSRKRYYELERKIEKGEQIPVRESLAREYRTVTKVREYELSEKTGKVTYRPISERSEQSQRSRIRLAEGEHTTLTSINAVRSAYESGSISAGDVRSIVGIWQEEYNFNDDHFDELLITIVGEDAEQE